MTYNIAYFFCFSRNFFIFFFKTYDNTPFKKTKTRSATGLNVFLKSSVSGQQKLPLLQSCESLHVPDRGASAMQKCLLHRLPLPGSRLPCSPDTSSLSTSAWESDNNGQTEYRSASMLPGSLQISENAGRTGQRRKTRVATRPTKSVKPSRPSKMKLTHRSE